MMKFDARRNFRPAFYRKNERHLTGRFSMPTSPDAWNGRCVALVDARFMGWLMGSDGSPAAPSADILHQLNAALTTALPGVQLLRVYWYSDVSAAQPVDKMVVRAVANASLDAGVSLVRQMASDMQRLSAAQSVDHVLLVADDERLLTCVDDAQLSGLCTHMLCDDSLSDFAQLQQDDPSWARLLAQADHRLVWPGERGSDITVLGGTQVSDTGRDAALILASIQDWWSSEPLEQQLAWKAELKLSQGIPQDVDRQLLLRLSRVLGRSLNSSRYTQVLR